MRRSYYLARAGRHNVTLRSTFATTSKAQSGAESFSPVVAWCDEVLAGGHSNPRAAGRYQPNNASNNWKNFRIWSFNELTWLGIFLPKTLNLVCNGFVSRLRHAYVYGNHDFTIDGFLAFASEFRNPIGKNLVKKGSICFYIVLIWLVLAIQQPPILKICIVCTRPLL